jgi:hypothetical protein
VFHRFGASIGLVLQRCGASIGSVFHRFGASPVRYLKGEVLQRCVASIGSVLQRRGASLYSVFLGSEAKSEKFKLFSKNRLRQKK